MLFIPTSGNSVPPFTGIQLAKGQLYNLDLDRFVNFQFNPDTYENQQEDTWLPLSWYGDATGGDLVYVGSGPRTFELPLLFVADPSAPRVEYNTEYPLSNPTLRFDFDALEKEINRWGQKIPQFGRPSRIRVIFGPSYFDGVILSKTFRKTSFFPDLTTKEGMLMLRFREWQIRRAS